MSRIKAALVQSNFDEYCVFGSMLVFDEMETDSGKADLRR